jgi:hypothetical protein
MQVIHCGLYFTPDHIEQARQQRSKAPYAAAWALLDSYAPTDEMARAQHGGLRYRFAGDTDAGARAVDYLRAADPSPDAGLPLFRVAAHLMTLAQVSELVRDHPAWGAKRAWLDAFAGCVADLGPPLDDLPLPDAAWLNALYLVGGVVLEHDAWFKGAVETFQRMVDLDIHPEGYIPRAVEAQVSQDHSLYRLLLTAQALILMAEAAGHAGVDLWAYEKRGVSAMTPLPYLLYYYYYPEKWRWDDSLELEKTQALYRQHAGLWEMAQRRAYSRDRRLLLDELRPVYDVWGGGLVTLSHGGEARRRGWFG